MDFVYMQILCDYQIDMREELLINIMVLKFRILTLLSNVRS